MEDKNHHFLLVPSKPLSLTRCPRLNGIYLVLYDLVHQVFVQNLSGASDFETVGPVLVPFTCTGWSQSRGCAGKIKRQLGKGSIFKS